MHLPPIKVNLSHVCNISTFVFSLAYGNLRNIIVNLFYGFFLTRWKCRWRLFVFFYNKETSIHSIIIVREISTWKQTSNHDGVSSSAITDRFRSCPSAQAHLCFSKPHSINQYFNHGERTKIQSWNPIFVAVHEERILSVILFNPYVEGKQCIAIS